MAILTISCVGKPAREIFEACADELKLMVINDVKNPKLMRLGDFNVFQFEVELPEEKMVEVRRGLMRRYSEEGTAMYKWGDANRVYMFKRLRI